MNIGVFGANWSPMYRWVSGAASFNVVAATATATRTPVPPTATATRAAAGVGTTVTLSATLSRGLGGSGWQVLLTDERGTVMGACARGSVCRARVTSRVPVTHVYTAWLSRAGGGVAAGDAHLGAAPVRWQ